MGSTGAFVYVSKSSAVPDDALVVSSAYNSLAGFQLDAGDYDGARANLASALEAWPDNAMALVNLANLEREHGSLKTALDLYLRVASLPRLRYEPSLKTTINNDSPREAEPAVEDPSDEEQEEDFDPYDWEDGWICGPREACQSTSAYLASLVLHQLGRGDESFGLLAKFGVTKKVSTAVWQCVLNKNVAGPSFSTPRQDNSDCLNPANVRLAADAPNVANNLRRRSSQTLPFGPKPIMSAEGISVFGTTCLDLQRILLKMLFSSLITQNWARQSSWC